MQLSIAVECTNIYVEHSLLAVEHLLKLSLRIFSASMTIKPAITAFVVAIAGIMLPAIAACIYIHNKMVVKLARVAAKL